MHFQKTRQKYKKKLIYASMEYTYLHFCDAKMHVEVAYVRKMYYLSSRNYLDAY